MSATLPTLERIANLEREVSRLHRILQEANARLAPEDPVNVEIGEVLGDCGGMEARAEKAEALLRKCLPRIVEPGSDLRDEIREALPK